MYTRFRPLFRGSVFNPVPGSAHPTRAGRAICGGDGNFGS